LRRPAKAWRDKGRKVGRDYISSAEGCNLIKKGFLHVPSLGIYNMPLLEIKETFKNDVGIFDHSPD